MYRVCRVHDVLRHRPMNRIQLLSQHRPRQSRIGPRLNIHPVLYVPMAQADERQQDRRGLLTWDIFALLGPWLTSSTRPALTTSETDDATSSGARAEGGRVMRLSHRQDKVAFQHYFQMRLGTRFDQTRQIVRPLWWKTK